jgi:hypothetical protein
MINNEDTSDIAVNNENHHQNDEDENEDSHLKSVSLDDSDL